MRYDVYFGTASNPPLSQSNLSSNTLSVGRLNPATTYYWRVVAKDLYGGETSGPVWSFDTLSHVPQVLNSQTYSANTVLTRDGGPYIIQGSLTIAQNVTLTIEPGTVIKMGANSQLVVNGSLKAVGTAANRIVFTSSKDDTYLGDTNGDGFGSIPAAGDWTYIYFTNTSSNCRLENVDILYAGYGTTGCAILIYSASPIISNCRISYSQGDAIYVQSGAPQIINSTITNCGRYGAYVAGGTPRIDGNTFTAVSNSDVYIQGGSAVVVNNSMGNLYVAGGTLSAMSGNTFTCSSQKPLRLLADDVGKFFNDNSFGSVAAGSYIEVVGGTIAHDATWPATMPYQIKGALTVQGTDGSDGITTLTIAAGAQLRFDQYTQMTIGASSGAPGALVAQGTAQNRIVFTSNLAAPAAGDWYGLTFYNTTNDATTVLAYCQIEYAGYGTTGRAIYIADASPSIANCTIRYSQGDAIYAQSGAPQITNNMISNCGRYGIYVVSGTPRIDGNTFAAVSNYDVYVQGGSGVPVTNNTFDTDIYVSGGTLAGFTGNTISYNASRPPRLNADDVGAYVSNNTINNPTGGYIEVAGRTISRDAVWSNVLPYNITGTITVQGADGADGVTTLTIAAGATLRFARYQFMGIGNSSGAPGALVVQGTSAAPVLFTSNQATKAAGDWGGVRFFNTADDIISAMNYCVLEYSGYGSYGAISVNQASPTIGHATVRQSSTYGIYASSGAPRIDGCQFEQSGNYDLYFTGTVGGSLTNSTIRNGLFLQANGTVAMSSNNFIYNNTYPIKAYADHVGAIVTGSTFSNVDANSYLEVSSGNITRDATWTGALPYRILSSPLIQGTDGTDGVTTLTLQAGATLRFNPYCYLQVGSTSGNPGALVTNGSATQKVLFTSGKTTPAAGDWYGIWLYNTASDALCRLNHTVVEYAGYGGTGSIYCYQANPTIADCAIRNGSSYGINIYASAPIINRCGISATSNYSLYYTGAVGGSVTDTTLDKGINVLTSGEILFSGNTVQYDNAFPVKAYADQVGSIMAGCAFTNVNSSSFVEVGNGTISRDATWTAALPYVITASPIVQGTAGADGVTTLTIEPGATLRFNRNMYLQVGAVSGNPGALVARGQYNRPIVFTSNQASPAAGDWNGIWFYNTALDSTSELTHTTVAYGGSGNYGNIYCYQASPAIRYSIIRNSSNYGLNTYQSTPILEANSFVSNATNGVYNATSGTTVIAEYNWWGHATGPYNAGANPSGQGNAVSNYVDFSPWATNEADKDGDGIPDAWEFANFGNLTTANATSDFDGDGVRDIDEYLAGTNPRSKDSDGDGMPDGWERAHGLNPLLNDALQDADGDGLSNLAEYLAGTSPTDGNDSGNITVDDFESGPSGLFYWYTAGANPWSRGTDRIYSGQYALKSFAIGNSQASSLETSVNCHAGQMGFMLSISSEANADVLEFYIDDELMGTWSGERAYGSVVFDITAGRHDFRWVYTKNGSGSAGEDAAWLDYIVFPGVPDSDNDNIKDGWEYRYFDALNHNMTADTDGDGVTDGNEYLQGTNPLVRN
ncbi:MAG: right-handed parallel beta-helix repeat-containing protein [Desulfobacteraceae bacterium]|nr:right-handed parallel beta-helix repeat-containing protein [Desulfobacteraceae bacterium]